MSSANEGLETMCVGQFLKKCKCTKNLDPNKRPNNLDCPDYLPVPVRYFNAVNDKEGKIK
jgi:hypothetical protein